MQSVKLWFVLRLAEKTTHKTKRLVCPGTVGNKRGYRFEGAYHSKSLYIIVKKTWRKRLTAFISTANRYNQASPDMVTAGRR